MKVDIVVYRFMGRENEGKCERHKKRKKEGGILKYLFMVIWHRTHGKGHSGSLYPDIGTF